MLYEVITATVNENGLVTAKMNGVVDITAKSEDNTSISTTCKVTVTGFASAIVNMPNISFEESEDLGIVSAYKEATVEYVTDGRITSYNVCYTKLLR